MLTKGFTLNRYGLDVRYVNEDDAEFIIDLRTDPKLSRYINATKPDIQAQKDWILKYKERESQGLDYYFIFEKNGIKLGLCRIYDIKQNEFTVGSWLFSPDAPKGAAILADIITREIAYESFPDKKLYFDVRKDNINVLRYQAAFHPEIIEEDDLSIYYTQSKELFNKTKRMILRMYYSDKTN